MWWQEGVGKRERKERTMSTGELIVLASKVRSAGFQYHVNSY